MDKFRRGVLTATAAAVAVGLAGCGTVDKFRYPYAQEDADTIFLDAVEATIGAKSLRVSGTFDPKGEATFNFSLMSNADKRCSGQMAFSTADFDVVTTPEGDYVKGSSSSWEQVKGVPTGGDAAVVRMLEDRWVKLDTKNSDFRFTVLCGLARELLTPEEKKDVDAGRVPDDLQLTHEGLSESGGQKAVKLNITDDKGTTDVWVSLDEPHYIVKMTGKSKKGTVKVVFSDFGFPADVSTPKGKDVLDIAKLSARSG